MALLPDHCYFLVRPHDHDGRHDQPGHPALPGGHRACARRRCLGRRMGDGELRIRGRMPDLQEQQGDRQRAHRGEHIGQGVVEIIGGAKLRNAEAQTGNQQHRPEGADRAPSAVQRHDVEGQESGHEGQLTADHGGQCRCRQSRHRAQHGDGRAESAERHRRGVENQHEHQRFERRKAAHDEQRGGDGDRRAESGNAFEQGSEAKTNGDQYHAPVVGQVLDHPGAKGIEAARGDGNVVEQQGIDDDPHHRPERKHRAVEGRGAGNARRQRPTAVTAMSSPTMRPANAACHAGRFSNSEKHQHGGDGQNGDQEGQRQAVADGCQQLMKHCSSPIRLSAILPQCTVLV